MGKLVPVEVVLDLIKEAMLRYHGRTKGFLIDGYPSEVSQGMIFEAEGELSFRLIFLNKIPRQPFLNHFAERITTSKFLTVARTLLS